MMSYNEEDEDEMATNDILARIDVRRERHICSKCDINPRIAYNAFTKSHCDSCGTELISANSDVDKLCEQCAVSEGRCIHCGGVMD